jgi:hypothetical protein
VRGRGSASLTFLTFALGGVKSPRKAGLMGEVLDLTLSLPPKRENLTSLKNKTIILENVRFVYPNLVRFR